MNETDLNPDWAPTSAEHKRAVKGLHDATREIDRTREAHRAAVAALDAAAINLIQAIVFDVPSADSDVNHLRHRIQYVIKQVRVNLP
jgi:hypothetical protein